MSTSKKRKSSEINSHPDMATIAASTNIARKALFQSRTPVVPLGLTYGKSNTSFAADAVVLECFIDFCCPFSKKIWDRLTLDVHKFYAAGSGKSPVKIVFHQIPQPWHPQSTLLHEVALASWIAGGDDKYELMHQSLFDVRDKFCDLDVYEMSRSQIYNSLCLATASQVGIEAKSLMELLTLDTSNGQRNSGNACTASLKWYVKQHRQRGIHVSPTCAVNGVEVNTSSSWSLEEWRKLLDPIVAAVKN